MTTKDEVRAVLRSFAEKMAEQRKRRGGAVDMEPVPETGKKR